MGVILPKVTERLKLRPVGASHNMEKIPQVVQVYKSNKIKEKISYFYPKTSACFPTSMYYK